MGLDNVRLNAVTAAPEPATFALYALTGLPLAGFSFISGQKVKEKPALRELFSPVQLQPTMRQRAFLKAGNQ